MAIRVGMEKSNFNLTCSLLSQYLKQKGRGGLGDLNLGFNCPSDLKAEEERPRTMNLLPGLENGGGGGGAVAAPMTMFYGGRVMVFDNFPADKAEELIAMVGRVSSTAGNSTSSRDAAAPTSTSGRGAAVAGATTAAAAARTDAQNVVVPSAAGLPIARRASVRRFLEKRKERNTSRAPYQLKASANDAMLDSSSLEPKKDEEKKPWLGLAPSKLEETL